MHRHFTENALNNAKSKTTKKPALVKKKEKMVEAKERKNLKNKKEEKKNNISDKKTQCKINTKSTSMRCANVGSYSVDFIFMVAKYEC